MELDLYFQIVEQNFLQSEDQYIYATEHKKPDAKELGEIFDQQLLVYNASLDVRFDLEEEMRQEALIPQVDLDDTQMDQIISQIESLRNTDGGDADIDLVLQDSYQSVLDLEKKAAKNKQDVDLAKELAMARETYDYMKTTVKDSVDKQKGAVKVPKADDESFRVVTFTRTLLDLHEDEIAAIEGEITSMRKEGPKAIKSHLEEAYRYYTEYNIELKNDIEDLDMQYKVNYLWTRYNIMKDFNKLEINRELEDMKNNDSAGFKKMMDDKFKKAKADKKADALDETDQIALLDDFKKASMEKDPEAAVAKLLDKQDAMVVEAIKAVKMAAKDRIGKEKTDKLKAAAELAQKKYLALKTEVKKEDDKRTMALEMA